MKAIASDLSVTESLPLCKSLPLLFWHPAPNSDEKPQVLDLSWQASHLSKVQLNGSLPNSPEFIHEL